VAIKVMNDPGHSSDEDSSRYYACIAYVQGIYDTYDSLTFWDIQRKSKKTCFREGFNTEQMIRVFVKYIDDNPRLLDIPPAPMLLGALRDSFPCVK
jgi:hypothetical protein